MVKDWCGNRKSDAIYDECRKEPKAKMAHRCGIRKSDAIYDECQKEPKVKVVHNLLLQNIQQEVVNNED